jgi:hypothetical protein
VLAVRFAGIAVGVPGVRLMNKHRFLPPLCCTGHPDEMTFEARAERDDTSLVQEFPKG